MIQNKKKTIPTPAALEALEALVDGGVFQYRDGHFIHHSYRNKCLQVTASTFASLSNNGWIKDRREDATITPLGVETVATYTNRKSIKRVALNFNTRLNAARRRLHFALIDAEVAEWRIRKAQKHIGESALVTSSSAGARFSAHAAKRAVSKIRVDIKALSAEARE